MKNGFLAAAAMTALFAAQGAAAQSTEQILNQFSHAGELLPDANKRGDLNKEKLYDFKDGGVNVGPSISEADVAGLALAPDAPEPKAESKKPAEAKAPEQEEPSLLGSYVDKIF